MKRTSSGGTTSANFIFNTAHHQTAMPY